MKMWKIMLGFILVPMLLIAGCSARAWRRDRVAKQFCESLIPQIEKVRQQTGSYPTQADPVWWAGQKVPTLIHAQSFYSVRGSNGFGFLFQNHYHPIVA